MPKNTVSTSTSTRKTTDLKFPIKNDVTKDERYTMPQFVTPTEKKNETKNNLSITKMI